ncbi:hypothetical protein BRARA_C01020 [Brassica rapa]|uniref:Uncharacterized protein n=1 Tax=Brassica campestris TaxID=3711 RepID=A0A397ZZT5_BRACM|nr:hypothetical protein BRARA_C01020 [Brassica rapa]
MNLLQHLEDVDLVGLDALLGSLLLLVSGDGGGILRKLLSSLWLLLRCCCGGGGGFCRRFLLCWFLVCLGHCYDY